MKEFLTMAQENQQRRQSESDECMKLKNVIVIFIINIEMCGVVFGTTVRPLYEKSELKLKDA
jgi:hypothetical protein